MTVRKVHGLLAGLSVIASAGTGLTADPPPSGKYWVYLGTYTGGKAGSKGIYRSELDLATGKLSAPEVAAEITNPSFVALAPDGTKLYAVGEVSGAGPNKNEGAVTVFAVDPASGKLTKLAERTTGGGAPCHVSVHPLGGMVLTANYGGGNWTLFYANDREGLSKPIAFKQLEGTGPNEQRQEKPHAHCGQFVDYTGFFVVDLGSDRVWAYQFDPNAGAAEPLPPFKLPPGSGPRHIALGPVGSKEPNIAYVNGELDSTINVVQFDWAKRTHEVVQSLSTLPGGKPVAGNSTAEVRVHPSGRFVYVSNRGHNSVAVFKVDLRTGKLTAVGHATSPDVKTPRNFNLDPTGKWMLVASQDGDNVAVFAVDPETGMPKATGDKIAVGRPVCVKFLAKP